MAILILLLTFTVGFNYANFVANVDEDDECGLVIEGNPDNMFDNYPDMPLPPGADIFMPGDDFDKFLEEFSKEILPPSLPFTPEWYIEDSNNPNRLIEA